MAAANEEIFKIESLVHWDNVIKANLLINADSPIFKGHFPGQPVVPGACMLQAVKDVLEKAMGYAVRLKKGDNLKFTGMIEPARTNTVVLDVAYKLIDGTISINAKLFDGDKVCFKFNGTFV